MSATDKVFVNGSLPDIDDVDLNGFNNENKNLIVGSNQTAIAADNQQTHEAVSRYVSYGNVLTASGPGNAILLTEVGNNRVPAALNGMGVRWLGVADNTDAVTLNVPGVSIFALRDNVGEPLLQGDLITGRFYSAVLNTNEAPDEWWLVEPTVRNTVTTQTFTTAGGDTWTKPDGVVKVVLEAVGGGGGGGSSASTPSAGGGGGGAGGFTRSPFDVTDITTLTLNIGFGGSGGTSGVGGTGGTTTVTGTGVSISITGGVGGLQAGVATNGVNGLGGVGSGGGVNLTGGNGNGGAIDAALGGVGGSSFFGGGGQGANTNGTGQPGIANGSGGGGGSISSGVTEVDGGDGAVGMVTITEYR